MQWQIFWTVTIRSFYVIQISKVVNKPHAKNLVTGSPRNSRSPSSHRESCIIVRFVQHSSHKMRCFNVQAVTLADPKFWLTKYFIPILQMICKTLHSNMTELCFATRHMSYNACFRNYYPLKLYERSVRESSTSPCLTPFAVFVGIFKFQCAKLHLAILSFQKAGYRPKREIYAHMDLKICRNVEQRLTVRIIKQRKDKTSLRKGTELWNMIENIKHVKIFLKRGGDVEPSKCFQSFLYNLKRWHSPPINVKSGLTAHNCI